jgi:formate hydrogenlyase subunit 3/multisubunit Na+/H+ antiporter MnhD subunit
MNFAMFNTPEIQGFMLLLGPALPLVFAMALPIRILRPAILKLMPWSFIPALLIPLLLPNGTQLILPRLFLEIHLGLDAIGRVFLFFTALLWLAAGVYACSYTRNDNHRTGFSVFYLLSACGNLGLIVSLDMLSFYLFFALMSFAAYGLVVHNRSLEARRAGRIYICLVVLGEVLLFSAIVIIAKPTGFLRLDHISYTSASNVAVVLVFLAFGIKTGVVPLHIWLPLAHPEAPTPASAVLSGAMIKAGLLGWLRFLPLGQSAAPQWGTVFMLVGLLSAFFAVLVGLSQKNPKTVLAYSSVSQMGLITIAVGMGLTTPTLWPLALTAVLFLSLHHALAKGALFLGVGVANSAPAGSGQRHWIVAGLLFLGLAMAGAPFTSGALAKAVLKSTGASMLLPWPVWLAGLLPLSGVGTTLLMTRFLVVMWPAKPAHTKLTTGLWLPWVSLLVLVAGFVWVVSAIADATWQPAAPVKLWDALWPVVSGAVIAGGFILLARKAGLKPSFIIPPGDFLVWVEKLTQFFKKSIYIIKKEALFYLNSYVLPLGHRWVGKIRYQPVLWNLETYLTRWIVAGTIFLLALIIIYLLLFAI